jgi:DNA (cytosine-5)-methyltransferase 1
MLSLARGKALEVIVRELESMGYRWAYRVVDAQSFGLPQRRQRVYLLATREYDPRDVLLTDEAGPPLMCADPDKVACGFYWTEGIRGLGWAINAVPTLKGGSTIGIPSPPAIRMPDGRIIKPDITDAERLQGFPAHWTKPAETVVRSSFRWRLVGNAVSVKAAEWIGRSLTQPGTYDGTWDAPLSPNRTWPAAAWSLGNGRFASRRSAWPTRPRRPIGLTEFLKKEGEPLSLRATAGFRKRTEVSKLRFPKGFLAAIDAHLARMRHASGDAPV